MNDTLAVAMRNIVNAARDTEVVSYDRELGYSSAIAEELRLDSPNYPQYLKKSSREFMDAFEILKASELDWVVVYSPFMSFSEGNQVQSFGRLPSKTERDFDSGRCRVCLQAIVHVEYTQKRVGIAY